MKYAIKKGVIAKLAVVVAVVITSITPYTQAELKQQLPQCRINTGGTPLQDERNVVAGEINDKGDVIVGGARITNIGLSLDYQQLLKEVEGLEQDLKDIPLEETVSRLNKSKIVEEKRRQLLDFKQEALRLAGTFSKIEINTERLKQVQQCFVLGKFREADAILKAEELSHDQERILSTIESKRRELDELHQQLIGNANEFLIKAQTVTTDPHNPNSFKDASRLYEQSIRSNMHFYTLFEYACFLQHHNQYHEAERYYQDAMKRYGGALDAPTRATMLNNMAALQSDKNEYENALKLHKEALEIYRELARSNPHAYLPSIAGTINHVAHVQYQKHDFDDAVKSHQEALEIYRNLVKSNPHTYLSYVATTLNDFGLLRHKKDEFEDALKFYNEALEIYRNLAGSNPRAYLPDVAMTLNNVAKKKKKKGEFEGTL
ncbi:MAG: tetratricopeptide repeat protein, partial [Planctomycetes bacterium]|nr:tetratricopeptide repeat protein [Planctomycetota bacterium]